MNKCRALSFAHATAGPRFPPRAVLRQPLSYYLDAVIKKLRREIAFYKSYDFTKHAVCVFPVVGCATDAQGGPLPEVVIIDLRDGDIKLSTGAVFDAPQDLPLAFQRGIPPEKQFYVENAHTHSYSFRATSSIR
jgi:hypothetical protein